MMQLLLEDYVTLMRVGCHDAERAAPQRVRINITADCAAPPQRDAIDDAYDYENFIRVVDGLRGTHHDLLETLAQKIATQLMADDRLTAVTIEIVKLDVIAEGRLGVRYSLGKERG